MAKKNLVPFFVSPSLYGLTRNYPDSEKLLSVLKASDDHAKKIIVRQWLTEGIPSVFESCPALFEELRGWLASRLDIHAKNITIVGSARFGFSLTPGEKYGTPFSSTSDFDLAIVSENLFENFRNEFDAFNEHYSSGLIYPQNSRQEKFWKDNLDVGSKNIKRGFFDSNKIPGYQRYPTIQHVGDVMWILCERLRLTNGAPSPKKASVRAYRNWDALISQASLNLKIT